MMQINTKTEYGLRCLLCLARENREEALSISEISQKEHVPKHYAQQILLRLRRGGIVKSTRGTEGGFALARAPETITVAQVIQVLEGVPFEDSCNHFNKEKSCGHQDGCSIRPVWQIISRRLWEALDRITLTQLLDDEKTVAQKLESAFSITGFQV
jgi:Rrf2 family iron-sulfur cluster assembly transcriptional regulator